MGRVKFWGFWNDRLRFLYSSGCCWEFWPFRPCCKVLSDATAVKKMMKFTHIFLLREIVFYSQIFIPFLVLVYCSIRIIKRLKQKSAGDKTKLRRAMFLVTSVVLVFAVCFLPYAFTRAVQLKFSELVMKEEKLLSLNCTMGLFVSLIWTVC